MAVNLGAGPKQCLYKIVDRVFPATRQGGTRLFKEFPLEFCGDRIPTAAPRYLRNFSSLAAATWLSRCFLRGRIVLSRLAVSEALFFAGARAGCLFSREFIWGA